MVISVDMHVSEFSSVFYGYCSQYYFHHKYNTAKVHGQATDGRESGSKEKKTGKLSFINATRCRHNHKTQYELNVSKNYLFTESVNI